jgi:hypothetical protein
VRPVTLRCPWKLVRSLAHQFAALADEVLLPPFYLVPELEVGGGVFFEGFWGCFLACSKNFSTSFRNAGLSSCGFDCAVELGGCLRVGDGILDDSLFLNFWVRRRGRRG